MLTRTLDEDLLALLRGEDDACPVCGERAELRAARLECTACGSVLRNGEVVRPRGSM